VLSHWAGPFLSDLQVPFIRSRGRLYAGKISLKSRNATQHCIGFIDGTLIEIARPAGLMQRATYSGHKRRNSLKRNVSLHQMAFIYMCLDHLRGAGMICSSTQSRILTVYSVMLCLLTARSAIFLATQGTLYDHILSPHTKVPYSLIRSSVLTSACPRFELVQSGRFGTLSGTSRMLHFHERWLCREHQWVRDIWQVACFGTLSVV
jgi:hypothetical protein